MFSILYVQSRKPGTNQNQGAAHHIKSRFYLHCLFVCLTSLGDVKSPAARKLLRRTPEIWSTSFTSLFKTKVRPPGDNKADEEDIRDIFLIRLALDSARGRVVPEQHKIDGGYSAQQNLARFGHLLGSEGSAFLSSFDPHEVHRALSGTFLHAIVPDNIVLLADQVTFYLPVGYLYALYKFIPVEVSDNLSFKVFGSALDQM